MFDKKISLLDVFAKEIEEEISSESQEDQEIEIISPTEPEVDKISIASLIQDPEPEQEEPEPEYFDINPPQYQAYDNTQPLPNFSKTIKLYRKLKKLIKNLISKKYDDIVSIIREKENSLKEEIDKIKNRSNSSISSTIGGMIASPTLTKDDVKTVHRVGHMLFSEKIVKRDESVIIDSINYNNSFNRMSWDLIATNNSGSRILAMTVNGFFSNDDVHHTVSNVINTENILYDVFVVKNDINTSLVFQNNSPGALSIIYRRTY